MFLSELKTGRIVPVPNLNNQSLPSSFRFISFYLYIVSKPLVKSIIEKYLLENAPINVHVGFHGITFNVPYPLCIKLIDDWTCALEQGYKLCVVSVRIS